MVMTKHTGVVEIGGRRVSVTIIERSVRRSGGEIPPSVCFAERCECGEYHYTKAIFRGETFILGIRGVDEGYMISVEKDCVKCTPAKFVLVK